MRQTKSSIMGALVGLTLFATNAQAETVPLPEVEWDTNLSFFQFDSDKFLGQRLSVSCPAGSVAGSDGAVHGSDVYSSKSPICVAAVHAGQITEAGGVVTVQLEPGQDAYQGSFRNGVETADLPGTKRSMIFVSKETMSAADESRSSHISNIKWDTKFTRTGPGASPPRRPDLHLQLPGRPRQHAFQTRGRHRRLRLRQHDLPRRRPRRPDHHRRRSGNAAHGTRQHQTHRQHPQRHRNQRRLKRHS